MRQEIVSQPTRPSVDLGLDGQGQENSAASVKPEDVHPLLWSLSSPTERQQLQAEDQYNDIIRNELSIAAREPVAFNKILTNSFGANTDVGKVEEIRQQILTGDSSSLPRIQLLDASQLQGAMGAYNANTNTIFLSRELVGTEQGKQTLLEEFGHSIDARINTTDAFGDEGAIFRHLIQGNNIEPATMNQLRSESDHGNILVNGNSMAVEFRGGYTGSDYPWNDGGVASTSPPPTTTSSSGYSGSDYPWNPGGAANSPVPVPVPVPVTDVGYTGSDYPWNPGGVANNPSTTAVNTDSTTSRGYTGSDYPWNPGGAANPNSTDFSPQVDDPTPTLEETEDRLLKLSEREREHLINPETGQVFSDDEITQGMVNALTRQREQLEQATGNIPQTMQIAQADLNTQIADVDRQLDQLQPSEITASTSNSASIIPASESVWVNDQHWLTSNLQPGEGEDYFGTITLEGYGDVPIHVPRTGTYGGFADGERVIVNSNASISDDGWTNVQIIGATTEIWQPSWGDRLAAGVAGTAGVSVPQAAVDPRSYTNGVIDEFGNIIIPQDQSFAPGGSNVPSSFDAPGTYHYNAAAGSANLLQLATQAGANIVQQDNNGMALGQVIVQTNEDGDTRAIVQFGQVSTQLGVGPFVNSAYVTVNSEGELSPIPVTYIPSNVSPSADEIRVGSDNVAPWNISEPYELDWVPASADRVHEACVQGEAVPLSDTNLIDPDTIGVSPPPEPLERAPERDGSVPPSGGWSGESVFDNNPNVNSAGIPGG